MGRWTPTSTEENGPKASCGHAAERAETQEGATPALTRPAAIRRERSVKLSELRCVIGSRPHPLMELGPDVHHVAQAPAARHRSPPSCTEVVRWKAAYSGVVSI